MRENKIVQYATWLFDLWRKNNRGYPVVKNTPSCKVSVKSLLVFGIPF